MFFKSPNGVECSARNIRPNARKAVEDVVALGQSPVITRIQVHC